jgi:SAM-dependent methyltransferase
MEGWWRDELASDPAYEDDVTPIVMDLIETRGRILDVGCGEGRLMAVLSNAGAEMVGIDLLDGLLATAREHGVVVIGELPDLSMFVDSAFDGAIISLVLEHLEDHAAMFTELARVVHPGGSLVLVVNHPTYTAPGSAPIQDGDDVLWRTGRYLETGYTDEPAADHRVRFHHRPMGMLLTDASSAGWDLEVLEEYGVTEGQISANPMLGLQRHIPRLMGARWRRR